MSRKTQLACNNFKVSTGGEWAETATWFGIHSFFYTCWQVKVKRPKEMAGWRWPHLQKYFLFRYSWKSAFPGGLQVFYHRWLRIPAIWAPLQVGSWYTPMESGPFQDTFPIEHGDIPLLCYLICQREVLCIYIYIIILPVPTGSTVYSWLLNLPPSATTPNVPPSEIRVHI